MLRTKSQRKKMCQCPIGHVAHLLGDSTTLLIVRDLLHGRSRFKDFSDSLSGVSTRTLTKKLRWLEENGIIMHDDTSGDYLLTDNGKGLKPVFVAMRRYRERYLKGC